MIVDFKFDIGQTVEVVGTGIVGVVKRFEQTADKALARVRGECDGQIVNGTYPIDRLRGLKPASQAWPSEQPRTKTKKGKASHGTNRAGTHNARTGKGSAKQHLSGTVDRNGDSRPCDDAGLHNRDARLGDVSRSE